MWWLQLAGRQGDQETLAVQGLDKGPTPWCLGCHLSTSLNRHNHAQHRCVFVLCAARRQAQEMLAAQGLDKGARDESLAPSDASEQMHVELIEGGPVLSMRITRSQNVQR